jgi:hypothetical protein
MDLSLTPIRSQEPLIIERLRLAFPAKTFTIERVPQVLSINEFTRHTSSSPFIGLAWTGMKPDPASGRMLKGVMQWRLVLIYKTSNSLEARFKGDTKGIGLDAMIDVAMVLLQGVSFEGQGHTAVHARQLGHRRRLEQRRYRHCPDRLHLLVRDHAGTARADDRR